MADKHGVIVRFSVDTIRISAADVKKITEIIIELSQQLSADLVSRLVIKVTPDGKNLKVDYMFYPLNAINMEEASEPIHCGQVTHCDWKKGPTSVSALGLSSNIKHQCQEWHLQLGKNMGLISAEKK